MSFKRSPSAALVGFGLVAALALGFVIGMYLGRSGAPVGWTAQASQQPPQPDSPWRPGQLADVADRVGVRADDRGAFVLADILDAIVEKLDENEARTFGEIGRVADRLGMPEGGRPTMPEVLGAVLDRMELAEGPGVGSLCYVRLLSAEYHSDEDSVTVTARTMPNIECLVEVQVGDWASEVDYEIVTADASGLVVWTAHNIRIAATETGWVQVTARPHSTNSCTDSGWYHTGPTPSP